MIGDIRSPLLRIALRILFGGMLVIAFLLFVLWRTENPRLQAARSQIIDFVSPTLEAVAGPSSALTRLFDTIESYSDLQAQNAYLRRQLERLRAWQEYAQRLEAENARLRALNQVKLPPRTAFVTAEIIADAGGPLTQSVLVNIGRDDGVFDGAPALDGAGVVGRVVGVGENSARIMLLTDPSSRTPVFVGDERRRAILQGENTSTPSLQFLSSRIRVAVGAKVVTSGEGGIFPAGLSVGRVFATDGPSPLVQLDANYRQLEFVKVQHRAGQRFDAPSGGLILRAPDQNATDQDAPHQDAAEQSTAEQDARAAQEATVDASGDGAVTQ